MKAKVGDLIKVTGSMQYIFVTDPVGIIKEIHMGVSFDKEYKIQWADPANILDGKGKTTSTSWLKREDFEIISEN
jgi:hypothetical protein